METQQKTLAQQISEALSQQRPQTTTLKFELTWDWFLSYFVSELAKNGIKEFSDASGVSQIGDWIRSGKRSLLIYGGVGNGKTTIAKAIQHAHNRWCVDNFKEDFYNAKFVTAKQVVGLAMEQQQGKRNEALKKLYTSIPVVIDDLGVEQTEVNDFGTIKTPVIDLIDERYQYRYATVITSNLDIEQIGQKYGIRVKDRIIEQYSVIGFNQKSFRK